MPSGPRPLWIVEGWVEVPEFMAGGDHDAGCRERAADQPSSIAAHAGTATGPGGLAESIDLAQAAGVPVLPIRRLRGAGLWRLG